MATATLKRQFITDSEGNPIGVILPLEEFELVEEILTQRLQAPDISVDEKLIQMQQAAQDPLFMADLEETMEDFATVDADWWEPN